MGPLCCCESTDLTPPCMSSITYVCSALPVREMGMLTV